MRYGLQAISRFCVLFFAFALLSVTGATSREARTAVDRGTPPDVIVKTATEEVVAIIKENRDAQTSPSDRKRVIVLIEQKVEPHFDFAAMTRFAVGVNWRRATPGQQGRLVEEFRALLLRTYAQVLLSYQDDTIVFKPFRAVSGSTDAMVRIELRQSGRSAINIDFAMEKTPEGWKVYDVTVGHASLITTYRSEFAQKVRESGIDGLISELSKKNRILKAR